jgi:hypothetical protein
LHAQEDRKTFEDYCATIVAEIEGGRMAEAFRIWDEMLNGDLSPCPPRPAPRARKTKSITKRWGASNFLGWLYDTRSVRSHSIHPLSLVSSNPDAVDAPARALTRGPATRKVPVAVLQRDALQVPSRAVAPPSLLPRRHIVTCGDGFQQPPPTLDTQFQSCFVSTTASHAGNSHSTPSTPLLPRDYDNSLNTLPPASLDYYAAYLDAPAARAALHVAHVPFGRNATDCELHLKARRPPGSPRPNRHRGANARSARGAAGGLHAVDGARAGHARGRAVPPPLPYCCPYPCPYCTLTPFLPSR